MSTPGASTTERRAPPAGRRSAAPRFRAPSRQRTDTPRTPNVTPTRGHASRAATTPSNPVATGPPATDRRVTRRADTARGRPAAMSRRAAVTSRPDMTRLDMTRGTPRTMRRGAPGETDTATITARTPDRKSVVYGKGGERGG